MDDIDKELISLIQLDGQMSCDKLGKAVGLSTSAVNDRIKKLQKDQTIIGWQAIINPSKVGFDVLAFVQVLVDEPKHKKTFVTAIEKTPEILECHHITGEWSYLLKIRCRSIRHLEVVINEKLKQVAGVMRTHTQLALSTLVERNFLPIKEN